MLPRYRSFLGYLAARQQYFVSQRKIQRYLGEVQPSPSSLVARVSNKECWCSFSCLTWLGCLTSPMMMVGNVDATMMMQGRKPPLVIELLPTCWRVRTVSTEKQRHGDGHKKTANLQYCWASRQVGGGSAVWESCTLGHGSAIRSLSGAVFFTHESMYVCI